MANDHLAACRRCGPQFRSQLFENEHLDRFRGRYVFVVGCRHCGNKQVSTTKVGYARDRWNQEQQS